MSAEPDVHCASAVHCGCRNLLDATNTASMVVMGARLRAVEAERDELARSLEVSASTVALLSAQVGMVEAERDEARALKVPPTCDELDMAHMDAAVVRIERDIAYKTIARLNRRAQEAERLALRAMRAGLHEAEGMRALVVYWRREAKRRLAAPPVPIKTDKPAATCRSTHHAGCACHEARRDALVAQLTAELAALRLMLREVAQTNGSGIDYALRCQRERDEARGEIAELRALLDAMSAARAPASADELDAARMDAAVARAHLATTKRELHRLIHGTAIEGDGACEHEIHADAARAWSRLWHREARRLWREVQALSGEMVSVRAGALREAADIARAHGGISAYYAIRQLAAEVEP